MSERGRQVSELTFTPFSNSAKAIWDFDGIYCSSRHIPHVRFPGLVHPGIVGCAPSAEILAEWNRREAELIAANKGNSREVAKPPEPKGTHAGSATGSLKEKIAREGARTIPVRWQMLLPRMKYYYFTSFLSRSVGYASMPRNYMLT